ncbi:MAG TPA: hypothetical protein VN442_13740 [Bryobacteraceae bacterium]|nr:hypothetical protein [Bryobacteraceae bacterium]
MTRRDFLWTAAIAAGVAPKSPVVVPVHRVVDTRTCTPEQLKRFWWTIWPEAVRDFNACGIQLQTSDANGEIRRSAADRPIFTGLKRGVINLLLTDHLPLYWDSSRALAGVTTIHEDYHICLIALRYAHRHQVPFLSVNTCVHELLHALMQDIFIGRPKWYQTGGREFRIDSYATALWLFHNGAAIRESAQTYVGRLRSDLTP